MRIQMVHRILRVADNLVEMDDRTIAYCLGRRFIFDRTLALRDVLRADGASIPEAAARWRWWEFPLEVGKRWQFSYRTDLDEAGATRNGAAARTDATFLVEAFEDVTVPAGTFQRL